MLLRGHTIIPNLSSSSVVCDFGANHAEFSLEIIQRFGCLCFAVEPNKTLIDAYPANERLRAFNLALSGQDGETEIEIGADSESSSIVARPQHVIERQRVATNTLTTFLDANGIEFVDLAKFDIEGAELPVFDSTSDDVLRRFGQITIEFHDFNGWVAVEDVQRILRRFADLNFAICRMTNTAHGDVLLANRDRIDFGPVRAAWVRTIEKYSRGIGRQLRSRLRASSTR